MDVLSGQMGMQAAQLQQTMSLSILNMAMKQGASMATEMIADMAPNVPVSPGETGYNLDVYA